MLLIATAINRRTKFFSVRAYGRRVIARQWSVGSKKQTVEVRLPNAPDARAYKMALAAEMEEKGFRLVR